MDDRAYKEYLRRKFIEHEGLCRRCGACCGSKEGDPCEHLRTRSDGLYFCDIYKNRFGLRKTVSGKPVLCVPIRDMLSKSWPGSSTCVYLREIRF